MCGIVGVAGEIGKKENAVFKDLLQIDVIRGPHSTGIAALTRGGHPKVFKRALLPNDLFAMKGCADMFNDFQLHQCLIGHNRWATVGKINAVNAHPFEFDTLVGVHNGTLRNKHRLIDHTQFDVDSENLFHSFEKVGVKDTIKNVEGAFALNWFTPEDKVVHFLRNDERPLFYTFAKDNKAMFWASERWMLDGVLTRHGVEFYEPAAFKQNEHYTLELPDNNCKTLDKFFTEEVEIYTPPKRVNHFQKSQDANKRLEEQLKNQGVVNRHPNGKVKTHSSSNVSSKSGNVTTGTTTTNTGTNTEGAASKKRDCAGTGCETKPSYQKGDIFLFRVPFQRPKDKQRYLLGVDSIGTADMSDGLSTQCRVYLPAGSVVRKEMLLDNTAWWEGVVNGTKKDGSVVIQGNSVEA